MQLELLGIRKDKIKQFNKKGIYSIEDLLDFIPRKYHDFSDIKTVKTAIDKEFQAITGVVLDKQIKGSNPKKQVINVKLVDSDNKTFSVSFFNQDYLFKKIRIGTKYIVCGKVNVLKDYGNYKTITNPLIFSENIEENTKIYPVYSAIEGMSDDFLLKQVLGALNLANKDDYIENILLYKYKLLPKYKAVQYLHRPNSLNDVKNGEHRLLFDDLFDFNFRLKESEQKINRETNIEVKTFKKAKILMDNLPFELTEGQRLTLRHFAQKMQKKIRINGLVQGDVGSGKTLVGILLMVTVSENGYQSCLVAPTNILAKQHYEEIKERVKPLGFNIGFLSSDLKAKEKKAVLKGLEDGSIDMVIGTHSLMSDNVKFKNLGISIIDEEHRFGVEQRDKLNKDGIHTVSMSATPIPRSLAISMYGDNMDVETITALPKGRKELITNIVKPKEEEQFYKKLLEEIKKGRQGYIVCPLVKKSNSELLKGVANATEEYIKAKKYFEKFGYKVGIVTGKMKESEVAEQIDKFRNKEFHILVATSIIEVGVNVPNATVIGIKSAERFGFAQLHQLRGRVGRGSYKSYCYLITEENKFEIFKETRDGFKISEKDLELRGAGEFLGTQQSGKNKHLMLMLSNPKLNISIRKDIDEIFNDRKRYLHYSDYINKRSVYEWEL